MNRLAQLQKQINRLTEDVDGLKPAYERYKEASSKLNDLKKEYSRIYLTERFNTLLQETEYREPDYPSVGQVASNGYALLSSKEQAEELQNHLRSNGSYYYGYKIEWAGPGPYKVVPSYKYDHDGEIIYSATFIKD